MSSDKSTPASGKPTGEAPAAPMSPRSYAAAVRGDPEAPTTTAASSSVASPWSRTDDIIASAQKSLAESRRLTAPYVAAAKKRQEQEAAAKKKEEQEAAAKKAKSSIASSPPPNTSVAASSSANASVASTSPTTVLPTSAAASSSAAPLMSTVSMALCGESERHRVEWEVMKAKMAMEGEQAPPTTVPIPIRRREAAPSSSMPTASQPEAQQSPSPAVTSPTRNPAPSSALPSPLGAVENLELCAMAEGVFKGTHRVLYGAPAAPIDASSPSAPPAAYSSPIPPPAAPSRRLPVQAPTYEVPPAWYADLEPLGWEVSASKSSKASRQNASTVEDSGSLATPEASVQAADRTHREDAVATPDITLSPQQPAESPVQASPEPQEPVNADSTASIPFDDSEDMDQAESSGNVTNSVETPPQTPETSGQAAVRVLHAEVNAAENILEKGTRQQMELDGTPEKPILDATEPSSSSGSFNNPPWYEKAAFRTPTPSKQAESPDESAPKKPRMSEDEDVAAEKDESAEKDASDDAEPADVNEEVQKPGPSTPRSLAKRPRSPTPDRAERPVIRPVLVATRRRRSNRSAASTTPPASPRSARAATPEPVHDVAPMDDMDVDEPADAQPNVAGAALPADFEMPPLEPFSASQSPARRSVSRSISSVPSAAGSVSEVSLASSSRPASSIRDLFCPRCHRDCNCPHVENPHPDFAPAPVRRLRGPRRLTTEEEWARMATVTDIIGVDLPAPEPVIMDTPFMIIDDGPLTAERQSQTIRRPTFQLVLYDTGVVVLRGHFRGVSLNSKLLALAAKQPTVIFNDPEDPADQIAAGHNHIVVRTQRGRIFTMGRGNEGQLGAHKRPRRIRQATANLASMRRYPRGGADVVFTDIRATGNVTRAKAEDGTWYVCGEGHKTLLTEVPHQDGN